VLVRLTNLRGLDLSIFDIDYDLNWHGVFLDADGLVLARFGGRDAETPGKHHSLAGLAYTMTQVLARYAQRRAPPGRVEPAYRRAEEYPAAQARLAPKSCIHCHHVREFQRDEDLRAGTWKRDDEWVYPEPGVLGLTLDLERGDQVRAVRTGSAAERTGLRAGDVLTSVNRRPVASIMDVQYALHRAPPRGALPVVWRRGGATLQGNIDLAEGWRQTDISWRWSLKKLSPGPQVQGDDLTAAEKGALGLGPRQLALRQNGFVPRAAQQAGIRVNDVIVGIDGQRLDLSARQFEAYVRLHYRPGAAVRYDILRDGQPLSIPIRLDGE